MKQAFSLPLAPRSSRNYLPAERRPELPVGNVFKMLVDGDSQAARCSAAANDGPDYINMQFGSSNRSPWVWASMKFGGNIKVVKNFGIGGDTTDKVLQRAYENGFAKYHYLANGISLQCGYNDFGAGFTLDKIKNNLLKIWSLACSFKKPVFWFNIIIPFSGASAYPRLEEITELNKWANQINWMFPNLYIVNAARAMMSKLNPLGIPFVGACDDVIHQSGWGGKLQGDEAALVGDRVFSKLRASPFCVHDARVNNTRSNQLIDNPLFQVTTPGTLLGGVTGQAATGVTIQTLSGAATVAASVTAADFGDGNKQVINISNVTAAVRVYLFTPNISTRVVAGETVEIECHVKVTQNGVTEWNIYFAETVGGTTKKYSSTLNDSLIYPPSWEGVQKSPDQTFEASISDLKPSMICGVAIGGNVTIELSYIAVNKIVA